MQPKRDVCIWFEGDSGDGIISMGQIVARCAARLGYHVYTYSTFLAVVRGGQVTFQLRLSTQPLLSQGERLDLLVALNREAVERLAPRLDADGLMLQPPLDAAPPLPCAINAIPIDYDAIAGEVAGSKRAKNMVAVGAVLALLGLNEEHCAEIIGQRFQAKGAAVAGSNIKAMRAGYAVGLARPELAAALRLPPVPERPRLLMSGNEAVAFGALVAGVRFFGGYPITPASEIMEWLAKSLPRVGGTMLQAEDEIAALGMCIGASYGGARAMTATSGPGLSLMLELLGLASMMELPVTIVDVQRAGPSTGMPTKEEQGDLNLAVYGGHGESPRIVIAPQTVVDCFEQTIRAVEMSHRYHVPVLVLSSQSLSHRMQTIDLPDFSHLELYREPLFQPGIGEEAFQRFADSTNGAPSPRSIPGTPGGTYRASGLEHDACGAPDFNPENREHMVERRRRRMRYIERDLHEREPEDTLSSHTEQTPFGMMSWGSTASTAREAAEVLRDEGYTLSSFFPYVLWPLPDHAIRGFLRSGIEKLFICELNASGQFAGIIRSHYAEQLAEAGIEVIPILKDDGLPFNPGEIRERIMLEIERRRMPVMEVCNE